MFSILIKFIEKNKFSRLNAKITQLILSKIFKGKQKLYLQTV